MRELLRSTRSWALITWLGLWASLILLIVPANSAPLDIAWSRFSFLDYRDTLWMPIRDFLQGGVPWDTAAYEARHPGVQPYLLYVPSYWWFFWPLALMDFQKSIVIWLAVTTASLVALTWVTLDRLCGPWLARHPWALLLASAALAISRPGRVSLFQGQWALPCALGAVVSILATSQGWHSRAGSLVAFVKPPVGIPVLLIQLVTGRLRTIATTLIVSGLLTLPVALLVLQREDGWSPTLQMLRNSLSQGSVIDGSVPSYIDLRGAVGNLWPTLPLWCHLALIVFASFLTLLPVVLDHRRGKPMGDHYIVGACLAMVLITPSLLYACLVLFPAAVVLVRRTINSRGASRVISAAGSSLICIPFLTPENLLAPLGGSPVTVNALGAACLTTTAAANVIGAWRATRSQSE